MAKKINVKVLRDTGVYEQLYPSTLAEQVVYESGKDLKSVINETKAVAQEAKTAVGNVSTQVQNVQSSVNTLSNTVSQQETKISKIETKIITISDNITIFTNKQVGTSAWKSNTTYKDFPYRASVSLTGCTADHVPDIYFDVDDASSGIFAPVSQSYAGGIYIWATEKPTSTITIPTIKIVKENTK